MVTVSRLEKTFGDNWTQPDVTTPVSWLSLANHCIKANKMGVVVTTTLSNASKHSCHESYFLAPPISSHVLCM